MTQSIAEQHGQEVKAGEQFQFGENWRAFLSTLNDKKIALAVESLRTALADDVSGKTFLDIGSGSGLFSLAARKLGAKVRSFDYDPSSVGCTTELRRRYFPDDPDWTVEQGSVLDRNFLASLGTYDIVYSWGVLHHTGSMWQALQDVKPLVRMDGRLYIAIYNELGAVTDNWRGIKRTYNRLPSPLRLPYALSIIAKTDGRQILSSIRHGKLMDYVRVWTKYQDSARGMNRWYDWIDWIGGYPYECATLEQLVDFFGKDGFQLKWVELRLNGTGCNELVFQRTADLGVFVDNPLPDSRFVVRRHGRRVVGPFRKTDAGWIAGIPEALRGTAAGNLVSFHNETLYGVALAGDAPDTIVVAPADWPQSRIDDTRIEVMRGRIQPVDTQTLHDYPGHMFGIGLAELKHLADDTTPTHNASPVYVFEDKTQLPYPHTIHDDIVKFGAGRFSHWSQEFLFASSDNTDPRQNGRTYELVIADPPA